MPQPALAGAHGPLMIGGALGTIISIERAVALRRRWPYTAPLLNGLGSVVLMADTQDWLTISHITERDT
jgi:hypothetical protein